MIKRTIIVHGSDKNVSIGSNDPETKVRIKPLPCQACTFPKCQCKDYCYKCAGAAHPTNMKT